MTGIKKSWAVSLLLLLSLTITADTWYNYYEKALKAAEKKQWHSVIENIRAALKEKKEPKLNSRTVGIRFVDYLPYYYLGLAYYHSGKVKAAQSAFQASLDYGAVEKRADLYNTLKEILDKINRELQAESKNIALIKQAINTADNLKKQGNLTAAKSEYIKARNLIEKTGLQAAQLDEVKRKLKDVTARLDQIKKSLSAAEKLYRDKKYPAAEAALKRILREDPGNNQASRLLEQISQERSRAAEEIKTTAPETGQKQPREATAEDTLMKEGKGLYLTGKFAEARKKFSAVLQLQADHREAQHWLENIDLAGAVQKLNTGIRDYFKGDLINSEKVFRETIKIFSQREGAEARKPLITAYQFLAVVLIDRHYLGGSPGNSLQEARQHIAKIFALEPDFRLEVKFFSPKVVKEFSR